jgi:hypothetical protein
MAAGVAMKEKLRMIQAACHRGLSTLLITTLITTGSQQLLERHENQQAVIL